MHRVSSLEGCLNDPPPLSSAQIKLNESVYLLSLSYCHHRIRELIMEQQFILLPAGSGSSLCPLFCTYEANKSQEP